MKRHSTDLVSVVFGFIFLMIAGWWVFGRSVHVSVSHGGWVLAGALIVVGLLGVVGSLRGDRRRDRVTAEPPSAGPVPPVFPAADWTPTDWTPTDSTPAVSTPTDSTPTAGTPTAETPTAESRPVETPAADTPTAETPTIEPEPGSPSDYRPGTGGGIY
jgi:hypothetical protein